MPDAEFEEICRSSFAYRVHSDELWTRYIESAAPHLLTGEDGVVRPITEGDFRVITGYSHTCDGESSLYGTRNFTPDGCEKDTLLPGLLTLTAFYTDGDAGEKLQEPIATFANYAIADSINEGRMRQCFTVMHDKYITKAFNDWSSDR